MAKYFLQFFLLSLMLLSCSKFDEGAVDSGILFSTGYSVSVVQNQSTKVSLYSGAADLLSKDGFGGYFNVKAFKENTPDDHFTSPTTVMYHTDTQNPEWRFYNPSINAFEKRYWPQTYKLDFLAYMPLKRPESAGVSITQELDPDTHISGFGYDNEGEDKGPTIICSALPVDKDGQQSAKEFIYAWTPSQNPETVSLTGNKVPLKFVHPFAVVYVKIGGAHGGTTVNSLGFQNIYNNGIHNVANSAWTPSGNLTTLSIDNINQKIPDDVQIGHTYGPYIVMPQLHTGGTDPVKIFVNFTWMNSIYNGVHALDTKWECGKKYTYNVLLGDGAEDIMVDVRVEAWDVPGNNQEIEVK